MYFKHAVDALGSKTVAAAVAALLASGLCRVVNGVAKELQHPFFTPVSQARGAKGFGIRVYGCGLLAAAPLLHACQPGAAPRA